VSRCRRSQLTGSVSRRLAQRSGAPLVGNLLSIGRENGICATRRRCIARDRAFLAGGKITHGNIASGNLMCEVAAIWGRTSRRIDVIFVRPDLSWWIFGNRRLSG